MTRSAFHRGSDRILGGVCSGLAAGLRVDAIWVRLAFVILAFLQGLGVFVYIVLWIVMPEETQTGPRSGFDSVADDLRRVGHELRGQFGGGPPGAGEGTSATSMRRDGLILGVVLVVLGALLFAVNTGLVTWGVIWPVAIIAVGVGLLLRAAGRRA